MTFVFYKIFISHLKLGVSLLGITMMKVVSIFGNPYNILVMAMLSILTMLFGLLSGYTFKEYHDLSSCFESKLFEESATAFLFVTIPIMADSSLDVIYMRRTNKYSPQNLGRLIIALCCFLCAVQFKFIQYTPSIIHLTTSPTFSFIFTLFSVRIMLIACMLFILCVCNPKIFTLWQVYLLNFISCLVVISRFFSIGNLNMLSEFAGVLTCISFILSIIFIVIWGYQLFKSSHTITVNEYTTILYYLTSTILEIISYINSFRRWFRGEFNTADNTNYTPKSLSFLIYTFIALIIILTIVPGRIARHEAYTYMKNNIKVKTEYVRFISHELRTPLNSVFLGLNLSISQIPEHSDNEENKERRDTLMEIASACSAALDILNQLLFFDKLDNGILELNKSKTRVTELIHDALKMFTVQIREKNIELKIQNCHRERKKHSSLMDFFSPRMRPSIHASPSHGSHEHSNIHDIYANEMIDIDKNKMIQVIRNIVSNAIKFTPEYGQISINLKFETNRHDLMQNRMSESDSKSSYTSQLLHLRDNAYSHLSSYWTIDKKDKRIDLQSATSGHTMMFTNSTSNEVTDLIEPNGISNLRTPIVDGTFSLVEPAHSQDDMENHILGTHRRAVLNSPRDYGPSVEGYLVIEITDTGAGISEENQQKLFREIIQFNPEILQNGGGSGLGMWISKGIVALHQGKISVFSEGEGRGSTFTVKLPMTRIYDETLSMSPKLIECLHVKDHTTLNQLNDCHVLTVPTNSTLRVSSKTHANTHMIDSVNISDSDVDDDVIVNLSLQENERFQKSTSSMYFHHQDHSHHTVPVDIHIHVHSNNNEKPSPNESIRNTVVSSDSMNLKTTTHEVEVDTTINTIEVQPTAPLLISKVIEQKYVLIVDDSSMNRKMVHRILKAQGYICIEAQDGALAVEYVQKMITAAHQSQSPSIPLSTTHTEVKGSDLNSAQKNEFISISVSDQRNLTQYVNCIIMDFMMPNMDGPTATAEIRKLGYTGPIIGATGNALQADIDYFIEKGANKVLIKPLDMSTLLFTINNCSSL